MPFTLRTLLLGVIWLFLATIGVAGRLREARYGGSNHSVRASSSYSVKTDNSYAMTAWDNNIRIYYIVRGTSRIQELRFNSDGSKLPTQSQAWTKGVTLEVPPELDGSLKLDGSIFVFNTFKSSPTYDRTGIELYLGGTGEYLYRFRSGGQSWGMLEKIPIPIRLPLSPIRAVPWVSGDGRLHRSIFFNDDTGSMQEISQGPYRVDTWTTAVRVGAAAFDFAVSATPWKDQGGNFHYNSERMMWGLSTVDTKILKGPNWQWEWPRFGTLEASPGGRFALLEGPVNQEVNFFFNTGKGDIVERRFNSFWTHEKGESNWYVKTYQSGQVTRGKNVRSNAPISAVQFTSGGLGRVCLLHLLEDGNLGVTVGQLNSPSWEPTVPIDVVQPVRVSHG